MVSAVASQALFFQRNSRNRAPRAAASLDRDASALKRARRAWRAGLWRSRPGIGGLCDPGIFENPGIFEKKQGATGITTVAPYVTGQWGRGG